MRELNPAEAAEPMEWLSLGDWPPAYGDGRGDTGCDHTEGWAGAVWVLHAMYEWAGPAPALTHHGLVGQAVERIGDRGREIAPEGEGFATQFGHPRTLVKADHVGAARP